MIQFTPTPVVVQHMKDCGLSLFDMVGIIPQMLSEDDPRPAVEQLHEGYAHGGGWNEFKGFALTDNHSENVELRYPGDPPMKAIAYAALRDDRIVLFESAWVAVIHADGTFNVARMD